MSEGVVLQNWRRFPRAHLSCDVTYGDRAQSWHSYTRDISLGGCRVAGYYPFPLGKALLLKVTHPSTPEPAAMMGKVARLYGGADNAVGLAFDKQWRGTAKFEEWVRKVIASNPDAEHTVSHMPERLPIDARLFRGPKPKIDRMLSPGEIALMQRLDHSVRPVSLMELRKQWGDDWERKGQVVFDLIADSIVLCSLPTRTSSSIAGQAPELAVTTFSKTSTNLMKALESEYGPIEKSFKQQLQKLTQEVIDKGPNGTSNQAASAASPLETAIKISWVQKK